METKKIFRLRKNTQLEKINNIQIPTTKSTPQNNENEKK